MVSDGQQIRIGPLVYTVKLVNRLEDEDRTPLNGRIQHDKCEILIDSDVSDQVQHVILWHEVLHGIIDGQGGHGHDEGFIEALAHEIVRVIQDNPILGPEQEMSIYDLDPFEYAIIKVQDEDGKPLVFDANGVGIHEFSPDGNKNEDGEELCWFCNKPREGHWVPPMVYRRFVGRCLREKGKSDDPNSI
jgi:hypothetical protein